MLCYKIREDIELVLSNLEMWITPPKSFKNHFVGLGIAFLNVVIVFVFVKGHMFYQWVS